MSIETLGDQMRVDNNQAQIERLENYFYRLAAAHPDEIDGEALTALRQRLNCRKNEEKNDGTNSS